MLRVLYQATRRSQRHALVTKGILPKAHYQRPQISMFASSKQNCYLAPRDLCAGLTVLVLSSRHSQTARLASSFPGTDHTIDINIPHLLHFSLGNAMITIILADIGAKNHYRVYKTRMIWCHTGDPLQWSKYSFSLLELCGRLV